MENLIEELTKVNPSNLSEEGLKLFNKINEIIDRNEELEENKELLEIKISASAHNQIEELRRENESYRDYYGNPPCYDDVKYIPKSLIKEKIEELKERLIYYQSLELPEVDDNGIRTGLIVNKTIMILKAKIQILEELLNPLKNVQEEK